MDTEVKPCPFCGGTDLSLYRLQEHDAPKRWDIDCQDCGGSIFVEGNRDEAIRAWNTRATLIPHGEGLSSWHVLDAELAAIYGEMGAINETVRKEQTKAQKERLDILRAECVVICAKRYALLNQRKTQS